MPLTTLREKGCFRLLLGGGLFFLICALSNPARAFDQSLHVNGQEFPAPVLNIMLDLLRRDDPGLTEQVFVDSLVENHLVAAHLRRQDLVGLALGENPVGFSPDVQLENRLVSTLRAAYRQSLAEAAEKLLDSNPMSLLRAPLNVSALRLDAVLGQGPRVIYALDDDEMARARQLVLGHYQLPGQQHDQVLTLADIYQRQNVQGRIALHDGDGQWLAREVHLFLAQRFVLWWSMHHSGLGDSGVALVRLIIEDQMIRQGWLAHTGVSAEIHAGNPALKARAQRVTEPEIRRWYQDHRERFHEIRSVRVWPVECETRTPCQALADRLNAGQSIDELRRLGAIPETAKVADQAVQIDRQPGVLPWRDAVALMQASREQVTPIAAPGNAGWRVFAIESRQWHTYPADSETVASVARREIARDALIHDYQQLRARLLARADIRSATP